MLGADGEPVADVPILLLPIRSSRERGLDLVAGWPLPEPAARAQTGEDGRFRLAAPGEGMWRLRIEAPGRVPMVRELTPLLTETGLAPLKLRQARTVEVRVRDEEGRPIAGAWVMASAGNQRFWWTGRRGSDWRPGRRIYRADDGGGVTVVAAADEELEIRATAHGFLEAEPLTTRGPTAELTLEAGAARLVEVRAPGGEAVPDALVRVGETLFPYGLTDESGRLAVVAPIDSELRLKVEAAEDLEGSERLEPGPTEQEASIVELTRIARIAGRVIDAGSREPVAGAWVWSREPGVHTRSDGAGRFETIAREHSSGGRWVVAEAAGYFGGYAQIAEGDESVTLAVEPAAAVRGEVVDGSGRAVPGAEVRALPVFDGSTRAMRLSREIPFGVTDERGRFEVGPLGPDSSYRILAVRSGFAPAEEKVSNLEPRKVRAGVRLVLAAGRAAVGIVLDARGRPLPGAEVTLSRAADTSSPRALFMASRLAAEEVPRTAYTGAEGRFEVPDLAGGRFDLEVRAAGHAPASVPGVEIPEGEGTTDVGTIELEAGAMVAGVVTDVEGNPLEGAEVRVSPSDPRSAMSFRLGMGGGEPEVVTDGDGRFELPDRRAGEHLEIMVRRSGYAARLVPGVEAPTVQPLVVELTPASRVSGRVVDAAGKPITGASVGIHAAAGAISRFGGRFLSAGTSARAVTDEDGRFEIEDVEPGKVRLVTEARGFQTSERADLEVPAASDLEDLETVLVPGATVSGRVLGADGAPVVGATIIIRQGGGGIRSFGPPTDGDGRYRMEGVEPGWRVFIAQHDKLGSATRELEVEAGDNRLDFAFEPGTRVTGRVVDDEGTAVGGAVLRLMASGAYWAGGEARSGADGSFAFEHVSPGSYTLSAEREGFAALRLEDPIEIGETPISGLEVVLTRGFAVVGQLRGLEAEDLSQVEIWAHSSGRGVALGQARFDGSYRIPNLAPGDWFVGARHPGGAQADGRVTVEPGVTETPLDLDFAGGLVLSGRISKSAGPLAGATVWASGVDVSSSGRGRTSHEGRFRIAGLEAGKYALSIMNDLGALLDTREIDLTGDLDVDLYVSASRLSGWVRDASSSEPLAGVIVSADPAASEPAQRSFALEDASRSDSSGYFTLQEVAAGTYRLKAEKEGYAAGELVITVEDGIDQDDLEFFLSPTEGLVLEVWLASGRPARSVDTALVDPAGRVVSGGRHATGENGVVRLTSAPPGEWELLIVADNAAVAALAVSVPGPRVRVVLEPAARLEIEVPELETETALATLQVIGTDGRPFRDLRWGGTMHGEWRLAYGKSRIERLPAGEWLLRATAPDGRAWEGRVSVGGGETRTLVLR